MRRIVFALPVLLAGCGTGPVGAFPREFRNAPGSFEFQTLDETADISRTDVFQWTNPGPVADIDHSTVTSAGDVRLVIRDADETEVYDEVQVPTPNEQAAVGTTGE